MDGLWRDRTRSSRIPALSPGKVAEVIGHTLDESPPGEATHWTVRAMAEASGISPAKVHEIWQEAGLAPHRVCRFKLSTDPAFAEKLEDVIGLYVDPPPHAIVLSLDEKRQVQALDRTQLGLTLKPGRAGTMTHDYKRKGTTTLFAALNVLDGTVVGRCIQRHRHRGLLRFLNAIERQTPPEGDPRDPRQLRRTQAPERAQLARPASALGVHFTPTSCSWLNAIEGFFARLTRRRLKRGTFPSLVALQEAINRASSRTTTKPPSRSPGRRSQSHHRRCQTRASNVGDNPVASVRALRSVLRDAGYLARGGQIVDATVIQARRPRLTRGEKATIKGGVVPSGWSQAKRAQMDTDGRWTAQAWA